MIDKEIIIDIRKVTGTTPPFNKEVLSSKKEVFGTVVETSAEEKVRAEAVGYVNIKRVDINEEEYDGETIAYLNDEGGSENLIYKIVRKRNKVYLYLSDIKTGD